MVTRTDLVRRRNVDEWDAGWVPTFTYASGRWTLDAQGEVRVHRAHHVGTVTWAQYYPTGVPPNHRLLRLPRVEEHGGRRRARCATR